jgi:hypothetical protein
MRIAPLAALVAAAGCLAAGCVALVVPAVADASPTCLSAVFETDGYGHGEDLANYAAFNAAVPAGYEAHPVPYQDGVFPLKDQKPLDEATAGGIAALNSAVTTFHALCPTAHITISGYSEGAIVAGDELSALAGSGAIPPSQLNGVLYGDPRRPFGAGGPGGTAGGVETNIPTFIPDVTMRGPRGFGALAVHEICNENDGICNSANMITNLLAFANGWAGYAEGDHGYDINPVRDQGAGLTLNLQTPRIGYGPPLPLPIGTPWQLQQTCGALCNPNAYLRTAVAALNALLPAQLRAELESQPWYLLLEHA